MTPPALPTLSGLAWSRHKKPGFATRVASHVSGREVRVALMSYPLYEFEATYNGLASASTAAFAGLGSSSLQSLMGFFLQLLGQAGVFLYTDPDDNAVTGQSIGSGDGATQSFVMGRTLGGFNEPVAWVNSVTNVYLNGAAQSASTWVFAAPNSIVFSSPPGAGVAITATFTYAFQCRFLDDQMDFEEFMSSLWKLDSMKFRSLKANATPTTVIPAPVVTAISPNTGVAAGGTSVTITGGFFTGATAVTIGGNATASVVVVNSTTITAVTPSSGVGGAVNVSVTTPNGTGTGINFYSYAAPWYTNYEIGGTNPYMFADWTTEGGTNRYYYNGASYAGSAAWLTAVGATFSRSSAAYYTNSSGVLASASSGVLRFDYDSVALTSKGILLEGASTNLVPYSAATTGWALDNATASSTGASSPDGGTAAIQITDNSTNSYHLFFRSISGGTTSGDTYTASAWAKAGTSNFVSLTVGRNSNLNGVSVAFNLATGTIGETQVNGSATLVSQSIQAFPNGWYRISVTGAINWTDGAIVIATSNLATGISYAGAYPAYAGSGSTIYVWGMQCELLGFASSYIATTSSSATRAADVFEVPWTAATATFRTKTISLNESAGDECLIGTTIADAPLYTASSTSLGTTQATAGALTQSSAVSAWSASNVSGIAGSGSGRTVGANNVTPASDSNALFSATPSDIFIGSNDGASDFSYGDFMQFGGWTVAATATQLQTMNNTP